MTIRKSKDQLVDRLKKEKFIFNEFSLVHEGNYSVADADWNYKDIPHLHHVHHVHQLAEAVPTYVDDEKIASIVVQKIPGLTIPLAVFIFENTPTSQLYYTASFFYILIIESTYKEISANKARVETTYCIGASKLFKWTFPILRWLIKRNYRDLMSADIPMRERRGQLRSWGYKFYKDDPTYSYLKSTNIQRTNVITPTVVMENNRIELKLDDILPKNGEYLWGRNDAWGLRIIRLANNISLFGRMCHHEGASLDGQPCLNDQLQCPWHGKLFSPLAKFQIQTNEEQSISTKFHSIICEHGLLRIKLKNIDKE